MSKLNTLENRREMLLKEFDNLFKLNLPEEKLIDCQIMISDELAEIAEEISYLE